MASEAKDETNPEHINLKVMGQDGNIVQFKIKKHTALKKLMATYCERAGLALQVIDHVQFHKTVLTSNISDDQILLRWYKDKRERHSQES